MYLSFLTITISNNVPYDSMCLNNKFSIFFNHQHNNTQLLECDHFAKCFSIHMFK